MSIDTKIREFTGKSKLELKAIFVDRTTKLLQLFSLHGMESDQTKTKTLLILITAASNADNNLSMTEYSFIIEALGLDISFKEMSQMIKEIASSIDPEGVAQQLAETFGSIDDDYREYLVDFCLAICMADGNVDRMERQFLESLLEQSIIINCRLSYSVTVETTEY